MNEGGHQVFRALAPAAALTTKVREEHTLTTSQRAVYRSTLEAGLTALWSAPRAGKSTLVLIRAAHAMREGYGPSTVLLTPTRARAALMRDALMAYATERAAQGEKPGEIPVVATVAAYAFALVKTHARAHQRPAPTLVTGADHDALISHIISERPELFDGIVPAASLSLPGFRTEVRDVMARAAERGLSPQALANLARTHHRPEWEAVAKTFAIYRRALALESHTALEAPVRLDGNQIIDEAIAIVRRDEHPAPALLLVDDAQDMTAGALRLLTALQSRVETTLVTASPDSAVETFRGAMPDALARLVRAATNTPHLTVRSHSLPEAVGADPRLSAMVARLHTRVPLAGAPVSSRPTAPQPHAVSQPDAPGPIGTHIAADAEGEARAIATVIRALEARDKVRADDIAVVCRSAAGARELADRLSRHGIDADASALVRPLREEPTVRDLIVLIDAARDRPLPDDAVVRLLRGPFGDVDDMRIRMIRRTLLHTSPTSTESGAAVTTASPSDVLVREAFMSATPLTGEISGHDAGKGNPRDERPARAARAILAPLERLRRMREAARRHLDAGDAGIHSLLWAMWETSGLARPWQDAALRAAHPSERDRARVMNARIDAISTLMNAADRYEERSGGHDVGVFLDGILAGAVPEDTLSARARIGGKVRVMTPAAAAGISVHTVILAGLNEGQWPNARIRSTLLGAADLALACDVPEAPRHAQAIRKIQRDAVLADELRMALAALSRATHRVFATAVRDSRAHPSALFRLLEAEAAADTSPAFSDDLFTHDLPGPFPEVRRLVGSLRRRLETHPDPVDQHFSAHQLARLVASDLPFAHPRTWYHHDATTTEPVINPTTPLRLSPSGLDTAHECPRAFLLERAGGDRGALEGPSLGTLVHRVAQEHPRAGATELIAAYVDLVGQPGPEASWRERADFARAISIFDKLGAYQQAHPDVVAVEEPFEVTLGNVRLRGSIDRIEREGTTPDAVTIVDYKTSATAISAREAARNLQLGAYQYALEERDNPPDAEPMSVVGARLVYVGTGTKNATVRAQAPAHEDADPAWFHRAVEQIDERIRARSLTLIPNSHCTVCAVKSSCPLYAEGEQL